MKEELKTLKDFEVNCREEGKAYSTDLKAEAVKHIKRFEESPYCGSYIGEINWIKHFFNLTEEDLK